MDSSKPPPQLSKPVSYAVQDTDRQRDLQSLDRTMTARLSYTFGCALLLFGIVLLLMVLPGILQADRTRYTAPRAGPRPQPAVAFTALLVPLAVFIAPAICLLCTVRPLRQGSRSAPVVTLIASIWIALGLGLALLGSVVAAIGPPQLRGDSSNLVIGFIFAILLLAIGKLIYHDICVLIRPTSGASNAALVGATQRISGGLAGKSDVATSMTRLGFLRIASGLITCIVAAILLAMTLLPAPPLPPPPLPPQATTPFTTDLHDAIGLDAPDRFLVIAHFARQRPLTAPQRDLLDSLLRESGRTVVRYAYDWQSLAPQPSVPAELTMPLTTQGVASRYVLNVEATRREQQELEALRRPNPMILNIGAQRWLWVASGLSVSGRSDGMERITRYVIGDACARYDPYHGNAPTSRWTFQAIQRELQRIAATNPSNFVTVAQADVITNRLLGVELDRLKETDDPRLHIDATMDAGGSIEIRSPFEHQWIDRDGSVHANSQQERARLAALVAAPRWLPIPSTGPGTLLLLGVLSMSISAFMIVRAGRIRRQTTLTSHSDRRSALLLALLSVGAVAVAVWIGGSILHALPETRDWLWSIHFAVGVLLIGTFILLTGVIAPLQLRRRLSLPNEQQVPG